MGNTHGVNASSSPKTRKLASTSAKLPWKRRAISTSLAKSEKRCVLSTPGAVAAPGTLPPAAEASTMRAFDSIGT